MLLHSQTVAGHPWPCLRLYRPADHADQEATDVQHQVRHHPVQKPVCCWASSRYFNRCVLYILSRPAESVSEQISVLEALHKLTPLWYVSVCPLTFHFKNIFFLFLTRPIGVWRLGPGGEQKTDALDTAITQLDLPQLLRPNKKDPSMADIDEEAELLVTTAGTDDGSPTAAQLIMAAGLIGET